MVDVVQLKFLQKSNEDQMMSLSKLFTKSPLVVHRYLSRTVFPTHMRSQRKKISASGQAVGGDMLFGRRVGFSGTLAMGARTMRAFARAPARDDAEAGAFAELVDALVWQGGEPAYEKPAEEEPAEEESSEEKTSVAALLVSGVARAGAALRHPKRAAEVQLGDDALVEMLAACAGSVKRVGAAETLRRREVRLRAAGDANAAAVRALSAEARDPRHARVSASVSHPYEASEKSETSSNREDVSPTTEETKKTNDADAETSSNLSLNFDPSVRLARPTSALAAATRLGVDLARRAHDHEPARDTTFDTPLPYVEHRTLARCTAHAAASRMVIHTPHETARAATRPAGAPVRW